MDHSTVITLPRPYKKLIMLSADLIMIPLALWSAFALRLGEWLPDVERFWWCFILTALVCIAAFIRLGLYRAVVRYMGSEVVYAVIKGVTVGAVVLALAAFLSQVPVFPRSVPVIFWLLAALYVGGSRFFVRAYFNWLTVNYQQRRPVVIYGAGHSGVRLANALMNGSEFLPVAFIDDSKTLQGSVINGLKVHKSRPSSIEKLLESFSVEQVLLAIPSASRVQRKAIVSRLAPFKIRLRTIPDLSDMVSGRASIDEIRDIAIEDLLGRDAIAPDQQLLTACIFNKNVLVTGAGGSIGSELCRQIIKQRPSSLILLDNSESHLYQIERELSALIHQHQWSVTLVAILGSVQNAPLIGRVISRYAIQTLYHAAAYKHVPMVQSNIVAGIRNNVWGTLITARLAADYQVETFVLISTDKAVRPSNIMGASKRVAELVLQSLSSLHGKTRFCMVRFGNVLGSSGSVVPLFREQIERGGPITVTHPQITRYFMTIPEAAELVLQAGAMATGGDVFVLDMGEPVKIADLAHKMILMMGYQTKQDDAINGIDIEFTGLRNGEKLYEELLIGEAVAGTRHPKIMRAEETCLSLTQMMPVLNELDQACHDFDGQRIIRILKQVVDGFSGNELIIDDLDVTYHPPQNNKVTSILPRVINKESA